MQLNDYVPFEWDHHPNHVLKKRHDNDDTVRGKCRKIGVSYYDTDELDQPVIAATEIPHEIKLNQRTLIPSIDWTLYEDDHPLHYDTTVYGDDWDIVRPYILLRSQILHHRLFDHSDTKKNQIDAKKSEFEEENDLEQIRDTLIDYDQAPRVHRFTDPDKLVSELEAEVWDANDVWWHIKDRIEIGWRNNEVMYVHDRFGCQIDQLAYIEGGLPEGMYAIDAKLSPEIHPNHLLQVEAYRRAASERFGEEVEGAIFRVIPDYESDGEVLTTHDDGWPSDELWEIIQGRLDRIENSLVQTCLANSSNITL